MNYITTTTYNRFVFKGHKSITKIICSFTNILMQKEKKLLDDMNFERTN